MKERPSILVADGSQTFLMYLAIILQRLGLEVLPVARAEEALRLMKVIAPDMLLISLDLPDGGLPLLEGLSREGVLTRTPVIAASSHLDPVTIETCFALGCIDFLGKPIDITHLNTALQKSATYFGGKRRFLRAPFTSKVFLAANGGSGEFHAVSLSEGGIYLRTLEPLPAGTEVSISLPLKGEELRPLAGRVIYSKGLPSGRFQVPPGMAVQFQGMSEGDYGLLRGYVSNLLVGDILEEQGEEVLAGRRLEA